MMAKVVFVVKKSLYTTKEESVSVVHIFYAETNINFFFFYLSILASRRVCVCVSVLFFSNLLPIQLYRTVIFFGRIALEMTWFSTERSFNLRFLTYVADKTSKLRYHSFFFFFCSSFCIFFFIFYFLLYNLFEAFFFLSQYPNIWYYIVYINVNNIIYDYYNYSNLHNTYILEITKN